MTEMIRTMLRRFADWALRAQRYRYLRAHLWDDAMHAMECRSC